ncbi:MAG: hypothetical protein ALECFALPRED_005253 [Alectoria fallacina]|uniref:Uncharacterized protein n=1 Tax=Alectoria fallacina TaxID=1903189 RepID=A0A8H3FWV0_9LECA|nr:MAG: hypothetical protein ALECFALPRED_005253 [Alectoria fallacina]
MATPNPLADSYPIPSLAVSKKTFCIAGIITTVYGLEELDTKVQDVACLWLLHPRLQAQECMEPVAASTINAWREGRPKPKNKKALGLICVSFDQRNHGSREVDALSNQAWRSGNKTHAQDMFASYHGTATDTSHLMNYITSYVFPTSEHFIVKHLVLGVNLGGHAGWHCIMHDSRITTAVVIIGCPDYVRLMSDRARLSKLATWTKSNPPGSSFLGSTDFPKGLVEAVEKYDPAGLLLGEVAFRNDDVYDRFPTVLEQKRLLPLMKESLQGKRILNMAGGADKLVPYKCGEPFFRWLKKATASDGWFNKGGLVFEDIVFDGVSHEMSPEMVKEAHRFVMEALEQTATESAGRGSKI